MLAPAAIQRVAQRTRLSVKLAWVGAGLIALVVGTAVVVLTFEIRASTRRRLADELLRNQDTFVQMQQQKLGQLSFAASLISRTASLPYVLDTYRAEALSGVHRTDLEQTVQRELEKLVRESSKDILLVTNDSGRVFASAAQRGEAVTLGTDLSPMLAVRQALDPGVSVDHGQLAVLREPGVDYQVAVYPIELGGYTLGTLVLGERLDSGFVAAARRVFNGYVAVTVGNQIVSGTLPGLNSGAIDALLAAKTSPSAPATVSVAREEFVVAPISLGATQGNVPVRLWLLQPLTATASAITRPLVTSLLLYGLFAVLLAGIAAGILARSLLRPLDRFVSYLRGGSAISGEPYARFDASDAPVEVRTLNESFSHLMDSLRESEAQLRQAQKLEAVGTLAGGIAHDFNNLLTVITGFTQMALEEIPDGTPIADDLGQVVSAAERATRLTRQLLAFSRKQVLKPTVLDLNVVTEDLAPMLRRLIGEHILLRIDRDNEPSRILADRGQLEQVIINLVVNGRDAMPRGGQITLRIQRSEGAVSFAAEDTGAGIPDHIRERIFEPFFTTKEQGKGTGLGLSTVYGIVKQSGGTIDVASSVGSGTTFTIVFPEAEDKKGTRSRQSGELESLRGKETILLVEDEPSVRALAQRALEDYGYKVVAASGPEEALDIAGKAKFDAMLTDVVMPGMGGPELAQRIQQMHAGIAVIYMSGYADDALKTFDVGNDVAFISKPFAPPELAHIVREAFGAKGIRKEAANV